MRRSLLPPRIRAAGSAESERLQELANYRQLPLEHGPLVMGACGGGGSGAGIRFCMPMTYAVLLNARKRTRTETGMAQKVQTFFIDDFDGSEAEGTVVFGLDGTQYEIDLNTSHAKELRTTLARYIDAGRKVTSAARRGRKIPADGISNTEARIWAKAHDLEVKDRGRVPADVLAQYRAATGR